jgi:hypothetical protein
VSLDENGSALTGTLLLTVPLFDRLTEQSPMNTEFYALPAHLCAPVIPTAKHGILGDMYLVWKYAPSYYFSFEETGTKARVLCVRN